MKAIHVEVLAAHGGGAGLREEALLQSALAAPQATTMGEPLFTDPVEIAEALQSIPWRWLSGNREPAPRRG